jgi:transcriptional regulator with XRE-family HTH domain
LRIIISGVSYYAMSKSFGARLRRLRVASGLSQRALCKASKVSETLVSKYENGRITEPSMGVVKRLAKQLGVPAAVLAFGKDETTNA